MICPKCQQNAPDNNYKCPHCGGILKEDFSPRDFQATPEKRKRVNVMPILLVVIVVGLALMIFFWTQRDKGSSPSYSDGNLREKKEAPLTQKEDGSNEPETQNGETYKEEVPEDPGEYPINTYNYDDIKKTDDPEKKPPPVSHEPGQRVNIEELVREGKITIFDFYSEYCGPCVIMSPKLEKLEQKRDDIVVVKIDVNREGVRGIDWRSPVVAQYGIRSIPYFIVYNEAGRRTHAGRSASRKVYELLYREGIR